VRHGATPTTGKLLPGRAKGLHLSDLGKAQAADAAERIGRYKKVAAVYSSPMERARETAAPIAKAVGTKVVVDRGLIECDFGEWTGAELAKLAKLPEWQVVQQAPSTFRFPGGESFEEMLVRITEALRRLVARHPGEVVVCVSHADPIKVAVADAMGCHLDQFQRFQVGTCSQSVIMFGGIAPVVLCIGSATTLPGAAA
jgi:probable phosphoglycerate mutase